MATPEPKPTLLASIGVSGGEASRSSSPQSHDQSTEPASRQHPPSLKRRAPAARRPRPISTDPQTLETPDTLPLALEGIRRRHKDRRASGARTPLAPLNVDLPLELLEHVRQVAQDIPYPLRRLAEEAIELWLEATGNHLAPRDRSIEDPVGE